MKKEKVFRILVEAYESQLEAAMIVAVKRMEDGGVASWEIDLSTEVYPEYFSDEEVTYARKISLAALGQAVEEVIKNKDSGCVEIRIRYCYFNDSSYLYRYYVHIEKNLAELDNQNNNKA